MGFGFSLLCFFILFPLSGILLIVWLITQKKIFGKMLGCIWGGLFGLYFVVAIIGFILSPKNLKRKDYYGQYVVNRNYFAGKQADWQYEHFRFEIKKNDSIYFYVTDKEKVIETYKGVIETTRRHQSARLIIRMDEPVHHIMSGNPTTIRSTWGFNLIFYSPKFHNMYFKKGKWKPIKPTN